jgi:signal transduction histidine kinase
MTELAVSRRDPVSQLIPLNERERVDALRRYEILDTPPDGAFDRITALAARIFRVPISIVSLVDEDRIWFKSRHGIEPEEIGRQHGLCASAILQDEAWVVTDARIDPRTLTNPLVVGALGLRFYAGMPLTTHDGYKLGTLNVIDRAPREVTADEIQTLEDLAAVVVDEMELRLAARREERRLEQLKGEFIATVSHQLRTPLAGVYGAALTLQREATLSSEELRRQLLELIGQESARLTGTVEQILLASELESGRFRIPEERFEPLPVLRASVDAAAKRLPPQLTIELRADGEVAASLVGDPHKLRSALDHLIDNAIKYSPSGGRIEVGALRRPRSVRFWVRDEGIGIPASERERVFDKFHRLDPNLTRGVNGCGLGLYISREFMRLMHGRIWLEPTTGPGSMFIIELPTSSA